MTLSVLLAGMFSVCFFNEVECRQMCLSCQYVGNPDLQGIECATAPWNWTWGGTRMRCPSRCFTNAHFDIETGKPTYVYRGCTREEREEGCRDEGIREHCWYSCEKEDYCNARTFTTSPSTLPSSAAAHPTLCLLFFAIAFCLLWK